MSWQWFNTFQNRLILYITISTLMPLTVLGFMSHRLTVSALNQQANDLTQSIIHQEVRNLEGFARDARRLANDLIRSTPIRSALEMARSSQQLSGIEQLRIRSNIESQLASTINLQGLIAIEVFTEGQVFSMGDLTAGTLYNRDRLLSWIDECERQQQAMCWPGIETNSQPASQYGFVIPAVVPITEFDQANLQYQTTGYLILKYDVERLYEEVHSEQSEFMYQVVVDNENRTVYHPHKSRLRQTFSIPSMDMNDALSKPVDAEVDDKAVRLFISEIPTMNWKVIGVIPLASITDRGLDISRIASLFFVFALMLMIIAVFFLSKRVVAPITHITNVIKGKSSGTLSSKTSIDEIQQLIHWFNQYKDIVDKEKVQQEELRIAYQELKQTQEHLIESEKMAALGNIVAGVAHEINTPIGVSITANSIYLENLPKITERLESGNITRTEMIDFLHQSGEAAEVLRVNLDRAAKLVNSFKRTAANQHQDNLTDFALKPYIDDVVNSLMPAIKGHDISVIISGSETIKIRSYPGILWQVFTNLIMNSLHHGFDPGDTGQITIDIVHEEYYVRVFYRDTGKGIPAENLTKIFNPFFTTRRHAGSTGLGLNIIYNLVSQDLKGHIACQSKPGHGVEFSLTLPYVVE
ncbi:sensor histidine kinase [Reinekea blandensis]|uniref:histidine kinase n=1 Tax=Reinekea blandensis MED297 TaxID=314283 RepID=A4BF93_9GAMM|nr:sensor histidine kinase [Reinekea blandensis]EAR09206.1 two-component sensor histidine kinase protein [Reinekea sp. MED297] [Reinekea blandensis MED297]